MFENKDDTILARWLAGTLTPEDKTGFEQSPEFEEYLDIVNGLERFKKPGFDKGALRIRIKNRIDQPKKGKVINLRPLLFVASIAASVLLIIGIFFNEVKYETIASQQLAITLPNGSEVQLNARSQITRTRFFWNNNKKINLQGEGFFKVEKGKELTVETTSGTVTVLGTQFNIKSRAQMFELKCYEGKVEFIAATTKEKVIITKGEAMKLVENTIEKETIEYSSPSWIDGRSSFNNVPLNEVLNELQIQYAITIENEAVNTSKRFTGSFFHDNLDIALKAVLVPMGIEYELTNNRKTLKLFSP